MNLLDQKCVACEGGIEPLNKESAEALLLQIPEWKLSDDGKSISRKFTFKNFKEALDFVNKVGDIAESEGHHPDIHLTDYKHVEINLTTHAIGGLSNNDFVVAANIDTI
jgi:4a-hydroxytetrahydrobiopterin dehydratase